MKNRSLFSQSFREQVLCGLLIAFSTVGLTSCRNGAQLAYKFPEFTFANRPIPPSLLANRVMVAVTTNGNSTGSLQILDAKRDLRSNIQNTKTSFSISGYSSGFPNLILNYPAEITGFVYSNAKGDIEIINYGKESVTGSAGTFPTLSTGVCQDRVGRPSIWMVQAPHNATPHPYLVPVIFSSPRSTHSSGVSGSAFTLTGCPLILSVVIYASLSGRDRRR